MNDMKIDKLTSFRVGLAEMQATLDRLEEWQPHIQEALDRSWNTATFDQVVDQVMQGNTKCRFWDDAFMLITISEQSNARHYHVFIAGGNMPTLVDAVPELIEEAREMNCDRITLVGREGWARVLKEKYPVKTLATIGLEV